MAGNSNPFKPKNTKWPVMMAVVAGTLVAIILTILFYASGSNVYLSFVIVTAGFFGTAYGVWRRRR